MDAPVSIVLERLARGERDAASALLPLVYEELRRLARARLARLPAGQTLQPTALVHEAYVELIGRGDPGWNGRGHFFGAAAQAMHDILVDHARRKGALKRGGDLARDEYDEHALADTLGTDAVDVLSLSSALERLRGEHPRPAAIAMGKLFAGADDADLAAAHEITVRTVERDWRFARAYLAKELAG
ncbi:MAG TPA: ECF-type sigma factor [Kofleriaceae bacterium]|nr:ECF-type sigma factor [Kofleriaceae bacterium]